LAQVVKGISVQSIQFQIFGASQSTYKVESHSKDEEKAIPFFLFLLGK
jgi:hypothetical protein